MAGQTVRGFDPAAVQRKHVKPITVLFGSDVPGIVLRIDRFIEVLAEAGEDVRVFSCAKDALGYVTSGDMFADHLCVIIRDGRDLAKSTADAKKDMSIFLSALSSYDAFSTFVIGFPLDKPTQQSKAFLDGLSGLGAMLREVSSPVARDKVLWAVEYAKSQGRALSEESASKAVEAADGELAKIQVILDEMIQELRYLSVEDIKEWLDSSENASVTDMRRAIFSGDRQKVISLRRTFPDTPAGYRSFVLRLRHAVFDLLLISESLDASAYLSFKKAQYGNDSYFPREFDSLLNNPVRKKSIEKAYSAVNDEIAALSGATAAKPSYKKVLSALFSI